MLMRKSRWVQVFMTILSFIGIKLSNTKKKTYSRLLNHLRTGVQSHKKLEERQIYERNGS